MSMLMNVARVIDMNTSSTSLKMMQTLYACTIASRLKNSRSKDEVREIATRDVPAWMTFFYLASVIEKVVGYCLDNATESTKKGFSLLKGEKEGRTLLKMLNPFNNEFKVRSFDDIKALKNIADPQNYKDLMRNKCGVYVTGLLASIAVLGILIPKINVAITRKKVLAEQQKKKAAAASTTNASNLNKTA